MTCSICRNRITTTTVISPSMAVDTYHCMIHDLPVEPTDYCEDSNGRLESQPTTCKNCTFCEERRVNVVRGLGLVEKSFNYCTLHDHYVEPTDYCEDYNGRLEA